MNFSSLIGKLKSLTSLSLSSSGGVAGDLEVADHRCRVVLASFPAFAHILGKPVVLGFPTREHEDLAVFKSIG